MGLGGKIAMPGAVGGVSATTSVAIPGVPGPPASDGVTVHSTD